MHRRRVHLADKLCKCQLCSRTFHTKSELKLHLRMHAPLVKAFECNMCEKTFATRSGKKLHMNNVHNCLKYQISCLFCGKCFRYKINLFNHMQRHVQERSYECQLCHNQFYSNSAKNTHMRTHTGEKNFQCKLCGKRFTAMNGLKCHLQNHQNMKKYHCVFCDRGFLSKYNYFKHILTEIRERPFGCPVCGKGCVSSSSLRAHLFCHQTGRYKCEKCEKVYKGKMDLKIHVQKWHGQWIDSIDCSYFCKYIYISYVCKSIFDYFIVKLLFKNTWSVELYHTCMQIIVLFIMFRKHLVWIWLK